MLLFLRDERRYKRLAAASPHRNHSQSTRGRYVTESAPSWRTPVQSGSNLDALGMTVPSIACVRCLDPRPTHLVGAWKNCPLYHAARRFALLPPLPPSVRLPYMCRHLGVSSAEFRYHCASAVQLPFCDAELRSLKRSSATFHSVARSNKLLGHDQPDECQSCPQSTARQQVG